MKKATTLFAAILLLAVGATAQKLSYQAVVRNDANELVTETTVQVAVMVLDASNAVQYAETHANVQTNRNGLLSLMIGDGISMSSNTLADVEWPGASLRTVITLPDNTTITNVTPVNSVPYSLYADNVDPDMVSNAIADYIASHNIGGEDNVQADWNETDQSSDAYIRNKPDLFSGDYNDLTNNPAINNGTLTLQQNGSNVGTFTANQGTDQTLNITTLTAAEVQTMINSGLADLQQHFDSLQAVVADQNAEIAHLNYVIDTLTFHCGVSTVTDHEGNVYHTVKIGDQCWTKENLRTTTSPSTGTYLIPPVGIGYTWSGKQARWYNNDSATYAPMNYGLLYNWNAAVDTFNTAYGETSVNTDESNAVSVTFSGHRRGICPAGWHLPSDAEWAQLTNYVSSQSEYTCGGNSGYIAKALASTEGWYECDEEWCEDCGIGENSSTNNASGFSAVPAGDCLGSSFDTAGYNALFWSSTQYDSNLAYGRDLSYFDAAVYRNYSLKGAGRSVRCLRD